MIIVQGADWAGGRPGDSARRSGLLGWRPLAAGDHQGRHEFSLRRSGLLRILMTAGAPPLPATEDLPLFLALKASSAPTRTVARRGSPHAKRKGGSPRQLRGHGAAFVMTLSCATWAERPPVGRFVLVALSLLGGAIHFIPGGRGFFTASMRDGRSRPDPLGRKRRPAAQLRRGIDPLRRSPCFTA